MGKRLTFLSPAYLEAYAQACNVRLPEAFRKLSRKNSFSGEDFQYYLLASSLYSSKIEGNTLDVNSFFRNRNRQPAKTTKEIREIEDLAKAYEFAVHNHLTKVHFLHAHKILSTTLLAAEERGTVRKYPVGVYDSKTLRPVYLAVEPEQVNAELFKLFADIALLLQRKLSYRETFYYASMIHLWTAKIHPFGDGNGRAARLLEKWFLAAKLGPPAWAILTEKYYWDNRPDYYQNIALGYNYYSLHWERCLPFLLMLPHALRELL
ncbi:MAG: Fic family protein [Prevotellaceae bacterium]|nr:Fic family protein [Prevotellaceae bacterium]